MSEQTGPWNKPVVVAATMLSSLVMGWLLWWHPLATSLAAMGIVLLFAGLTRTACCLEVAESGPDGADDDAGASVSVP